MSQTGAGLDAALDGIGLTAVSDNFVTDALAEGRLVRVPQDWRPVLQGFVLYYPRQRRMSSALRAFIDRLRAHHAG